MLVETDSPYLAPVPQRGKKNRPAWVPHVGQFIADLRDESVEEFAAAAVAATHAACGQQLTDGGGCAVELPTLSGPHRLQIRSVHLT